MTLPAVDELLADLTERRRSHCLAVARKAASAGARYVPAEQLPDLVTAAALHDVGYAERWVDSGFHPIDGAQALRSLGFSRLVCHLVAHHTSAQIEAQERSLDPDIFAPFGYDGDARIASSVLAWADLNTGPAGEDVTVGERIQEILHRYEPASPVARYVRGADAWLRAAGSGPLGSIHGSE